MSGAFNGFPGAPAPGGVPGGVPGQQAAPMGGFVLQIPADPTWEPIDTTDTLDMDGFYAARISKEKASTDTNKTAGVFFTFELMDQDVLGKRLSKKMMDPKATKSDSWWVWRSLIRSIAGNTELAKQGFSYTVGMMTGQYVYFRVGAYYGDDGEMRSGVDAFVTRSEWEEAQKAGGTRYRWPHKTRTANAGGSSAVGALPAGLPSTFPGAGGGGLPGMPIAAGGAPQPGVAPMQSAASTQGPFGAPPTNAAPPPLAPPAAQQQQAPFQTAQNPFGAPPAAGPPAAAGAAPSPFGAAPASPFGAPPPLAPPPVNGTAPQPAAGGFAGFPPVPGST